MTKQSNDSPALAPQPSTPEQFKADYPSLREVPADVLASRLVGSLILQKGNLNKYQAVLQKFIENYRNAPSPALAEPAAPSELPDTVRFSLALLKSMENTQLEHKGATTDLSSKDAYQLAANCLNLAHYEIKRAADGDPTTRSKTILQSVAAAPSKGMDRIVAAWETFYRSLPDGEFVGLGEMRTVMGELGWKCYPSSVLAVAGAESGVPLEEKK